MIIGSYLTVELPGERMRATVKDVIDEKTVVVEIIIIPMTKSHDYKQGNFVECALENGIFGKNWVGKYKMLPLEEVKEVKTLKQKKARLSGK